MASKLQPCPWSKAEGSRSGPRLRAPGRDHVGVVGPRNRAGREQEEAAAHAGGAHAGESRRRESAAARGAGRAWPADEGSLQPGGRRADPGGNRRGHGVREEGHTGKAPRRTAGQQRQPGGRLRILPA